MIETFYGTFPSQGYVQATMQPEELAPVQLEIDNIQKDFNSAPINDLGHASNLQNEFYLKDCVKHLENLIGPLCQQYCKHSAYGDQSKTNYYSKMLGSIINPNTNILEHIHTMGSSVLRCGLKSLTPWSKKKLM